MYDILHNFSERFVTVQDFFLNVEELMKTSIP